MEVEPRDRATGLNSDHVRQQFIRSLTEAIAWCGEAGSLSQPKTSLRSCKRDLEDLSSQSHQVFRVSLERSDRLRSAGKRNLRPATDLCGGRLLAYFPDESLACGMAEVESLGFFDANNVPPYDTWVWMVRNVRTFTRDHGARWEEEVNYLVTWIPPEFIPLATGGMKVNPEQCIMWLDTMDDEFVQSVRRLGFLC